MSTAAERREQRAALCARMAAEHPNDKVAYVVALAHAACDAVDIMVPGGGDVPCPDGGEPRRMTVEDVYSPKEIRLLTLLRERYGEALRVSVHRGSEANYRMVWCFHPDFLMPESPITARMLDRFVVGPADADEFYALHERCCKLLAIASWYGLEQVLLLMGHPHLDEMVATAFVDPVTVGTVRHVPVLQAVRGGDFRRCPAFGAPREIGSPDALLNEGVVVDLGRGHRYRIWLDWRQLTGDDSGWPERHAHGEHLLRLERTTDRMTPQSKTGVPYRWLRVRGRGRSQQEDTARPFRGQAPTCLMTFEAGGDCTWCVMVNLDEQGEIAVAWLEASG